MMKSVNVWQKWVNEEKKKEILLCFFFVTFIHTQNGMLDLCSSEAAWGFYYFGLYSSVAVVGLQIVKENFSCFVSI